MFDFRRGLPFSLVFVLAIACVDPHRVGYGGVDAGADSGQPPVGAPHVRACLYEGTVELACGQDSQEFVAQLVTTPFPMGSTLKRTLRLFSDGGREVTVAKVTTSGDSDFTYSPSVHDIQGLSLASGHHLDIEVSFSPMAGGPRTGTLTIETNDPANERLVVTFDAFADGPALCFCVGNEGSSLCKGVPTVDFGTVSVGGSGRKFVRLVSCGSQAAKFTAVELQNSDSTSVFTATGLPSVGSSLAPADTPIEAKLTFSPNQAKAYVGQNGGGRLRVETENQRWSIDLIGNGTSTGCKLVASTMTVDFGQGARGQTSQRVLALSNVGGEDCTFPAAPSITSGANVAFGVVHYPTTEIAPGQTDRITVSYTPADLAGPDAGELTIPYSDASGSMTSLLVIALRGTPVPMANCKLELLPGGNAAFGRVLDFGRVLVNSSRTMTISLKNVGSSVCEISNVKLQPGAYWNSFPPSLPSSDFQLVSKPTAPLAPGETAVVEVSFSPTVAGTYGGQGAGPNTVNVVAQTSDTTLNGQDCASIVTGGTATPGCVAWGLRGTGANKDLRIQPADVNFGPVTVGCTSQEQTVTIHNDGPSSVQIRNLFIDPPTSASLFTLTKPPLPLTLKAGDSVKIPFRYHPVTGGLDSAMLMIDIGSPQSTLTSLLLRGVGVTTAQHSDLFTQPAARKTDLLFVVDHSASMTQELTFLANHAHVFIDEAANVNSDYQIAVITTDVGDPSQSGQFQGSPKIIRPSINAAAQLAATFNSLGSLNRVQQAGLDAMYFALSPPLINDPARNGGFLRPDARLVVIVVSDQDDASLADTSLYTSFLESVKRGPNTLVTSLSAIIGDAPSGCMSVNGSATAGNRYSEVLTKSSGLFQSVCSTDWALVAQELAVNALSLPSAFRLTRPAIANPTTVKVNGTAVSSTQWSYNATANTVVFSPTAVPSANATVSVEYEAVCY